MAVYPLPESHFGAEISSVGLNDQFGLNYEPAGRRVSEQTLHCLSDDRGFSALSSVSGKGKTWTRFLCSVHSVRRLQLCQVFAWSNAGKQWMINEQWKQRKPFTYRGIENNVISTEHNMMSAYKFYSALDNASTSINLFSFLFLTYHCGSSYWLTHAPFKLTHV